MPASFPALAQLDLGDDLTCGHSFPDTYEHPVRGSITYWVILGQSNYCPRFQIPLLQIGAPNTFLMGLKVE